MRILTWFLLASPLVAQVAPGLGRGYLGELEHTGRQVLQLAEAVPEAKYSWRPAPGVMSVAEVYTHIYEGNFFLLSQAGHPVPKEMQTKTTSKAEIIARLKRSLAEVKQKYEATSPAEMQRPVKFLGTVDSKVENLYLRILAHISEHMGQSIAYARMNGVVPPWSVKP
ncbi:MAG: DinB family protein [Bryobacteraceae bacterium]|nr:DinB family protein [Bryobacteraceae bacterium]